MSVIPELGVDLEEARKLVAELSSEASEGAAAMEREAAGLAAAARDVTRLGQRLPPLLDELARAGDPPQDERAAGAAQRLRARIAAAALPAATARLQAAWEPLVAAAEEAARALAGPLADLARDLAERASALDRVAAEVAEEHRAVLGAAAGSTDGLEPGGRNFTQGSGAAGGALDALAAGHAEQRAALAGTALDGVGRWVEEEASPSLRADLRRHAQTAREHLRTYAESAAAAAEAHRAVCEGGARALAAHASELPSRLAEGERRAVEAARTQRERARGTARSAEAAAATTQDTAALFDRVDELGRGFDPAEWSLA